MNFNSQPRRVLEIEIEIEKNGLKIYIFLELLNNKK